MTHQVPSFEVLGVKINALRVSDLVPIVEDWIGRDEKTYVVLTGVHGVVEMQGDEELRRINNASGLTTPDGMPIVWLGRRHGFPRVEKVYAPDVMNELYSAGVSRGWRHFLYGGDEGVADRLAGELVRRFPGIAIAGTICPPFRTLSEDEKQAYAATIDGSRADIVWVGLGCPKQERWMADFRPRIAAPVLIGVGAGFDFLSGRKPLAPVWVQRSGFEWLFRLTSEPRRLWPRYSRIVPRFIAAIARDELRRLARSRRS
jgi:N-acetylglucosaminyldiphosphoundecaprenol N-acetyl-beta-D-mannosaminyltransferase